MPRVLVLFILLGALVGAIAERAVGTDGPAPAGSTGAAADSAPAPAPAVALSLSRTSALFGDAVLATGTGSPGAEVVVERLAVTGWRPLAVALAGADGGFRIGLLAHAGGELRARVPATGAASASVPLTVAPVARARARGAVAFDGVEVSARVKPWAVAGRALLIVEQGGKEVARASATVSHGRLAARPRLPGFGLFRVRVELPPTDGIAARTLSLRLRAEPEPTSFGDRGPAVRGLASRLVELGFHLPRVSADFGPEVYDQVIAFQKATGLARTGAMSEADWKRLAATSTPRPRYAKPADHLEVDIARQILLVVRDGKTAAVVPVSTGATGNTPHGKFRILRKDPFTTTWLGPAILYRTMTFWKNEIAVHGFPSVPPYPASHGCVRVPMWAADWLYRQTPVGQRIVVY